MKTIMEEGDCGARLPASGVKPASCDGSTAAKLKKKSKSSRKQRYKLQNAAILILSYTVVASYLFVSCSGQANEMSLNLTVPKDSSSIKEKPRTPRRAKSPKSQLETSSNRTGPVRAKSKSPNPSFCSVLSRVKDWELGAFTPKTALAENVDVFKGSNVPCSDSSGGSDAKRPSIDNKQEAVDFEPWKPSPTGSPDPGADHPPDQVDGKIKSELLKSTLSANIGKLTICQHFSCFRVTETFSRSDDLRVEKLLHSVPQNSNNLCNNIIFYICLPRLPLHDCQTSLEHSL